MYIQQRIGPFTASTGITFGVTGATITYIGIEAPHTVFNTVTSQQNSNNDKHTNVSFIINNNNINNGNEIYISPGDILEFTDLTIADQIIITPQQNCNDDVIINVGYEIINEE